MEGRDLLTLVGTVAAVAAIPVTVLVGRWARPRRARLAFGFTKRSLTVALSERIEVRIDGVDVADPWLLSVRLANRGTRDIRSADFDRDRPILIEIGPAVPVSLLDEPSGGVWSRDSISLAKNQNAVALAPERVAKGAELQLTVIVSGKPEPTLIHHLIDIEVESEGEIERKIGVSAARFASPIFLGVAVALRLLAGNVGEQALAYWPLTIYAAIFGAGGVLALLFPSRFVALMDRFERTLPMDRRKRLQSSQYES
ncbi:hypothetical protein ACOCJ4_05600 [Knoellia sp. CPCC 206435]|uniref:hypothetical protein n=1 Tax=Knoellia terrae TaxID=3404797 RepID=UPI003B42F551